MPTPPVEPSPPTPDRPPLSTQEQLRLVEALLDIIPDFFYVHTYDMRFVWANRHAASYFGTTKDGIIGKRLDELDRDEQQARFFIEVCQRVMREGVARLTDDLSYRRRDGSAGFLRQHDIPFVHPITGETMLLGMSRDVTAERELVEERVRRAGLERELEIAREIQRSLRPEVAPSMPGVGFAAYSEPANYAGGDFYDWWVAPDGRAILCIGDVTGHGVGPALLAAACRAYARVLLLSHALDAAVVRLGELLAPDLGEGKFITFAAVEVSPDGRTLRIASAGHGPTMVVRDHGASVETIGTHGPPLGVVPGLALEPPTEVVLKPGDALVLLSDGVIEAHSPSRELFGQARLRQALATNASADAPTIVERIVSEVCAFCEGSPAEDDVTLLVARVQG